MDNKINWENDTRSLSTKINYKELSNNDFEKILNQALKEGVEKYNNDEAESIKIRIVNVPSCEIEDMFNLDITDFNGWQCDWWSHFYFEGTKVNVFGCAWYANATLTIGEE